MLERYVRLTAKEMIQLLIIIGMSFLSAIALCMKFEDQGDLTDTSKMSGLLKAIYGLRDGMVGTSAVSALIFFVMLIVTLYLWRERCDLCGSFVPFNLFIAIVWVMGISFRIDDTLFALHSSSGQKMKTMIYILGTTFFLQIFSILFVHLIQSRTDIRTGDGGLCGFYRRHPFPASFLGLILLWSPQVLLSYPGAVCPDAWNQIEMFFGIQKFTAHHPPAHTLLSGFLLKLGVLVGHGNLGLFLSVLLQVFVLALVLAYQFMLLRDVGAPSWLRMLSFFIAVICPYYTSYVCVILKDNLYSYALVLFIIELVQMCRMKEEYLKSRRHLLLLFLAVVGTILFRNNGNYVIIPTIVVLIILLFVRGIKINNSKFILKGLVILILPVILANGFQAFLMNHYHIERTSVRDALSFPFQQTARFVKECGDEVTAEEEQIIDSVLDYRRLAEKYDPKISDPVKATFRKNCTGKDLTAYLRVWLKQGLRHPMVYLKATMNQNYYLLSPIVPNDTMYSHTIYEYRKRTMKLCKSLNIHEVPMIQKLDTYKTAINKALFSFPVTGILFSLAFYNILIIWLIVLSLRKRKWVMLLLVLPSLLSDAIIVLAPVIKGHPRYGFPIIYSMPVIIACYICLYRKDMQGD